MLETTIIYQDGKVFKDIEFQIMIRKERLRVHELSMRKALKLAGINGPRGTDNMGVDYSRVTSSTPAVHIGLGDAYRMIEQDQKNIKRLREEIDLLRSRKRNLLRILKSLEGLEEQIFYHRVIMDKTQEAAAEMIGVSPRHLQRIEKQMKDNLISFEF